MASIDNVEGSKVAFGEKPVFLAHGERDDVIQVKFAKESAEKIREFGGSPATSPRFTSRE